jgi:hypothetical protein
MNTSDLSKENQTVSTKIVFDLISKVNNYTMFFKSLSKTLDVLTPALEGHKLEELVNYLSPLFLHVSECIRLIEASANYIDYLKQETKDVYSDF